MIYLICYEKESLKREGDFILYKLTCNGAAAIQLDERLGSDWLQIKDVQSLQ